jgi:hypothetical protein
LHAGLISSQPSKPNDGGALSITRAYKPRAEALAAIPELKQVWHPRSDERLQQDAQCALLKALEMTLAND